MGDETIDRIQIVYEKARHHRTFHADGAWAAVTPQLEVQIALFSDLQPLPDEATYHVNPSGKLGDEIKDRKTVRFFVRETDVTVVMNRDVVNNLIELLQRTVSQIDRHIADVQKEAEKVPSES